MVRRRNLTSKKVGKYDRIRSDGTSWGRERRPNRKRVPDRKVEPGGNKIWTGVGVVEPLWIGKGKGAQGCESLEVGKIQYPYYCVVDNNSRNMKCNY